MGPDRRVYYRQRLLMDGGVNAAYWFGELLRMTDGARARDPLLQERLANNDRVSCANRVTWTRQHSIYELTTP